MRLVFTPTASQDMQQIRSYTRARFGIRQERELVRRFAELSEKLTEFPLSGVSCGVRDVRTVRVSGTPFVWAYHVDRQHKVVRILACFHTAQQWPELQ